jgi:hypothetical protein
VVCADIMICSLISAGFDIVLAISAGISCKDSATKNAMSSGIPRMRRSSTFPRFGAPKIYVSPNSDRLAEEFNFLSYRDVSPGQDSNFHRLPANWRLRNEFAGQLMT